MSFSRKALLLIAALATACGHKESGPPPKYAFIGFENLSGDTSLDWAARGAGEFLAGSLRNAMQSPVFSSDAIVRAGQPLGAHPPGAPSSSAARDSALVAGANRIVSGYLERVPAGIRVTASEEDAATHKTIRTLSATAATPFDALTALSHDFSAQAGPPPSKNADAFRLYSTALSAAPVAAVPLLMQAVQFDPDFGRAWVQLARTYVTLHDRPQAEDVIAQAHQHKLSALDQAWLNFESADLAGDRTESLAAMTKVADIDASDGVLARNLADADTVAGRFQDAANVWRRLSKDSPTDPNVWNQLGYTLGWAGDYSGALAATAEYAKIRPNDANPLDTRGDIQYWFGKYADAGASYAAAHAKAAGFLSGGELYKEAWAKFLASDKPAADSLMQQFRDVREKAKDPTINLLAGSWLYRTGRMQEAVALLSKAPYDDSPDAAPVIRTETASQLAVWDLLAGDRAAAAKDIAAVASTNLTPNDLLVRFAAQPSASAAEWESRAAHISPQLSSLRNAALGYALILDDKKQAAIPVWEQIVQQSSATDFFARTILARLKGAAVDHAAVPDPSTLNPFSPLLDKL